MTKRRYVGLFFSFTAMLSAPLVAHAQSNSQSVVHFKAYVTSLDSGNKEQLRKLLPTLKNAGSITITGYEQKTSAHDKAGAIGQKRAIAVRDNLQSMGITTPITVLNGKFPTSNPYSAKSREAVITIRQSAINPTPKPVPTKPVTHTHFVMKSFFAPVHGAPHDCVSGHNSFWPTSMTINGNGYSHTQSTITQYNGAFVPQGHAPTPIGTQDVCELDTTFQDLPAGTYIVTLNVQHNSGFLPWSSLWIASDKTYTMPDEISSYLTPTPNTWLGPNGSSTDRCYYGNAYTTIGTQPVAKISVTTDGKNGIGPLFYLNDDC